MADIGPTLREARMRARIDIADVETATKIRAKYLRALENEEWDLLPGPTFVKSFLRTYGEYLGLDVTLLLEEYKRRHERPSDLDQLPISPHSTPRRSPRPPRVPRGWIVAAAIVALLALFAFIGSQSDDGEDPATTTTTTEERSEEAAAERRRERRRARERRERRERRRRAARRSVRLQLVPEGIVFACVVDASGNPVVNGLNLEPGSPTETFRSRRFRITVGNGQVVLRINGRRVAVPDREDAVGYEITGRGRRELPEGERPTCQ